MKKQVFNPYLPSYEYIPDGEPRIFGNRVYIYGSHDRFGGNTYCENDYVCWSAPVENLSDWKYEGVIFQKTDHPQDAIHARTNLYAPDVIQGPDHAYYLYYSMSDSSIISVAKCDTPTGKYQYIGDVQYANTKQRSTRIAGYESGDFFQFDPSIFIDDDQRIYLYSGYAPSKACDAKGRRFVGCHAYELEADMLTVKQGPLLVIPKEWKREEKAAYFEAPSMRKIGDWYYLVYSARVTGLYYYYSKNPLSGFTFGGRIHSTSDIGLNGHDEMHPAYPVGNIHGGIVAIENQYFIFDHRHTNHSSFQRQGVAEPIVIGADGQIKQAEATSCGLNKGPLSGLGSYPAYIACHLSYPQEVAEENRLACMTQDSEDVAEYSVETLTRPIQYLHAVSHGCCFGYRYFEMKETVDKISFWLRGKAKGTLTLAFQEKGETVGTANITLEEESDKNWKKTEMSCKIPIGVHALFFTYHGVGSFDVSYFTLQEMGRENQDDLSCFKTRQ